MNRTIATLALVFFCACDGPAAPTDSGAHPDAGLDSGGPTSVCDRDSRCEDGLYCTINTCRPGDPAADENGCIVTGTPCSATETCSEADRRCEAADCSVPDRDDDGHDSIACDGDDCDDDDPLLHPGGAEVCGPGGDSHDEDCRDETLASADDGDMDGDGEIRSECCNGDSCGTDCDDSNPLVNTTIAEVCNGVDDDCSGAADDPADGATLCPGGTCIAGRCSFSPWDRVMGGPNGGITGITIDGNGNIYVVGGEIGDGADFGSGPTTTPVVASYTADGTLRWVFQYTGDAWSGRGLDVTVDRAESRLYVLGRTTSPIMLGTVPVEGPGGFLAAFALSTSGAANPLWAVPVPAIFAGEPYSIDASNGRVVIAGRFNGAFDFDHTITRTAVGLEDGFVATFDASGALLWVRTFGGSGASARVTGSSIDADGNVYVAGTFGGTVDTGSGAVTSDDTASFVTALTPLGGPQWSHVYDSVGADASGPIRAGAGRVVLGGTIGGAVDFGGSTVGAAGDGYVLALSTDGSYSWERLFTPGALGGSSQVIDVAVLDDGTIWAVGNFRGTIDFGGGGLTSEIGDYPGDTEPGQDLFMVHYAADRVHLVDRRLGGPGTQFMTGLGVGRGGAVTIAGEFESTINLGSGTRTEGGRFGFVARTAD